jgi:hypothetical protein
VVEDGGMNRDKLLDSIQLQAWKGSLTEALYASGRSNYVAEAARLLTDDTVRRPAIPEEAPKAMGVALEIGGYETALQQTASVSFLLFYAETWDGVDADRVDQLVERGFEMMSEQRRRAGKTTAPTSRSDRFPMLPLWWVADARQTFGPVRAYIESQPAYQRLHEVKHDLYDNLGTENAEILQMLWHLGIATAFAWMYAEEDFAKVEPVVENGHQSSDSEEPLTEEDVDNFLRHLYPPDHLFHPDNWLHRRSRRRSLREKLGFPPSRRG